jgi:hypothetical protein
MACKCVAQEECHIIKIGLVIGRAHVCEPHPDQKKKNKQSSCTSNMLTSFALLSTNEREVPRKAMAKLNSKVYGKNQLKRLWQNSTQKATAKLNSKGYGKTQLNSLQLLLHELFLGM